MDAAQKSLLLAYCRESPDEMSPDEHLLMEMFYMAAVDYMADAGVSLPKEEGRLAKYNLVVFAMALTAWDHRDLAEIAATAENPTMRRYINQLKLSEPGAEE